MRALTIFNILFWSSCAVAQENTLPLSAAPVAPAIGTPLSPTILAALIGAAVGVVTLIAKDFVLPLLQEKRTKISGQREILRLYMAPLSAAGEKLVWRFKEIFIDSRHHFLKSSTMPLVYNEYKRRSTLFRIATILGWMRAIQLELNALPRISSGLSLPVFDAIESFRSALADGPEVERLRLNQLCTLWGLGAVPDEKRHRLATQFEIKLYELGGDQLRHDSSYLQRLPEPQKLALCRDLANFLCVELGRASLGEGVVAETVARAIEGLSYREALIYRDWQDAIGDSMLERDEDSPRRFKTADSCSSRPS
jgi:hypothetical protein